MRSSSKKVELKKLRALQKHKEQLQRELEASDEEESTRRAPKRPAGGKGKGKRIGGLNVNDNWEGLMSQSIISDDSNGFPTIQEECPHLIWLRQCLQMFPQ